MKLLPSPALSVGAIPITQPATMGGIYAIMPTADSLPLPGLFWGYRGAMYLLPLFEGPCG